jgi:hypothetical protein
VNGESSSLIIAMRGDLEKGGLAARRGQQGCANRWRARFALSKVVWLTITDIGRRWPDDGRWACQLRQDAQHTDSKAAGHPSPARSRAHQRGCQRPGRGAKLGRNGGHKFARALSAMIPSPNVYRDGHGRLRQRGAIQSKTCGYVRLVDTWRPTETLQSSQRRIDSQGDPNLKCAIAGRTSERT